MKQRINPYIRFNRTAQGPYAQRIAVESYGKTFFQGACFRVVSATIGDPSPIQTVVCFNEPPDEATCGVVHPDSDFWFFNNGGNMNVEAYSGSGPGANCLTFDTEDTTEGNGISETDVVTMDYALNTPGACHKSGESDPDCILSQIIGYPVTNKIYHVTTATVPYTNPSLVVVEFDSALGTIGTNWLVVVNSSSVTISDASIVNGELHFTLADPIAETDTVELDHTSLTGGAVAVDGRALYRFIVYSVDNQVDETAPSVPDNFSATPVWYDQVDLAWDASTDAGSGVKEYVIYRDFVEIDRVAVPTLTYSDTGLTGGTSYTYTVTAEDNAGNESTGATPDIATTFLPPPLVTDAEVGNVADDIVVVTFDSEVVSSNYQTGWSFTADAVNKPIASAAKTQTTEVQFTLTGDIVAGTTVVYNYNSSSGDYANTDTVPMASDSGAVTNNVTSGPAIPDFHGYGLDTNGQFRGLVVGDGSLTFARASGATVTDWEGLVKTVLANELRIKNARRVENLFTATEDNQDAAWSVVNVTVNSATLITFTAASARLTEGITTAEGNLYTLSFSARRISGNTALKFRHESSATGADTAFTITDSTQRYSITVLGRTGGGTVKFGIIDKNASGWGQIEITKWQLEDVTGQTNQNPSEYVSVGVESGDYHGVGVDGVAVFAYENGNTVASNVVTEAKGADLTTDWGALYEPAATNYSDGGDDLSGGAETVDLTAGGTGDFTLSVEGSAAVTVAAGTATGTGFAQATEGNSVTFNLSVTGTVTLTLDSGTLDQVNGLAVKQVEQASEASSWIPTDGGTANRTADDGSPSFDYANHNQTESTIVFDLVMEAEEDQGIFNVANAEAGIVSYDTTNKFQTDDGTNQANVDPTLGSNLGDTIRIAVDYNTNLVIGYKNITDAGSWVWDTDSASYDGAFATSSVINLFFGLAVPSSIKNLYIYNTQQGKAFIEANF